MLAYPNFGLPFILHTDVLGEGIGATLYQIQDGQTWDIAYGSRTFNGAEQKLFSLPLWVPCLEEGRHQEISYLFVWMQVPPSYWK